MAQVNNHSIEQVMQVTATGRDFRTENPTFHADKKMPVK